MPRLHRVVRKAPPPTSASFDEQLWPVAIALVVLAGFLIGVSLAYQPLTGVPWHRTAWPSVIGIPLVVAAALAALIRIDSRSFRRSLQLSLILCAILHVALVIQMLETRMFAGLSPAAVQRQKREIIERRPLKIVPDYHPTVLVPEEDRPRQDFEKPVPTQSPELTHEPEKFLRQSSPEDQSPQVPQPVPMLDPQPTTEPNVIDRRQANEVAPRLAAQPSRLSRQVAKAAARATQSIEMPAAATASQSATNVQPAELPIERSQAESVSAARPAAEPSTTATTAANAPIRATRETLPAESAAAQSALARSPAPPPASRSARATAIEAPATVAQNNPPSLEPFSTAATRAPAASAATARPGAEPPAVANRTATSQSIAQAKAAPDRTNPAAANPADVARQAAPRQPAVANVQPAAAALPAAPSVAARPMTEVRPNAATIARTAASASAAQPSATSPEAASAAARELSATSNTRALAPDRSVASLNPPSPQATAPRRAVATAPQPSSPTTIDSPAVAVAPASETAAAARRMALSKAQGGSVGAGRSPNVESAAPGGASPALVASGSMNRAEATQRSSSAEALAPSAASRLPRSRAEAAIATAPVRTQPLDAAGVAGATQVAEVTASSGAALTSARSGAKSGAIAADKGTSQIDLGPTQRVAEAGIGRAASGGGQAELALQSPAPQLARQSVSGGAPQMSLAAATVGEVAAPAASGGAAPPATASAAALPATRGAGGEGIAAAASVGPARADAATGEPSANLVAAAVSRRETSEAEIAASSPGSNATDDKNPRLTRAAVSGQASAIDRTAEQIAVSGGARATVQPTALAASDVGSPRPAAAGRGEGPAANRPRIGDESAGSPLGEVGSAIAVRPTKTGDVAAAPDAAIATNAGNVARRAAVAASGAVSTQVAAIPEVGPSSAVAQAEVDHLLSGGAGQSPMSRRADNALTIEVQASAGPGGLGADYTPEVGINTRQSRADSLNVQLRSARFVRTQIGGVPAISTSAIVSSEAFSSRGARTQGDTPAGGRGTPEPQTEEAIERGLAFLVRFQLPDGGWSLQGFPEGAELASDTAATALAVIAFQGAGYHHREFHYKDVVRGGIDALLKGQKTNGDLFVPLDDASNRSVWLYSHSLAAIALCEAYGMTQDPALREPAQKAVEFVIAAQQPERGGWRYAPGVGADTSVSGWMMMALKSGELAGLNVPGGTYDKINRWLDDAQQSPAEPHLYRYNPFAPDTSEQRHGRAASKTMTAVGLLMRLYSGWRRDNPNMIRGAAFLSEHLPAVGTVREPERDTYYWYYATQVMAHMGGEHWQRWIAKLHPLLIESQVRQGVYAGSWDPLAGVPDRWGPHAGRLYVTALNLLSLEVQYRKLPLYDDAIR